MQEWTSLLSMLIALIAVIVGPFVTLKVSRKQVIAPMRQAWINDLRKLLAEFIACSARLHSNHIRSSLTADPEKQVLYNRLVHLEAEISLYLNEKEKDHMALIVLTSDMIDLTHKIDMEVRQLLALSGEYENKIVNLSRKILKQEWEVVKAH